MALGLVLAVLGCGSSGGPPDTGAGAGQPVPATLNCVDLCARIGQCGEILCNEDTMSSRYTGFGSLLAQQCEVTCTDSLVMSNVTAAQWQCVFESSCRAVFGHDVCHGMSHYNCS